MNSECVIVAARRTPIGSLLGRLKTVTAPQLGAYAIGAVLDESGVGGAAIDEVLMGCVLAAGVGMAPARQAALRAGVAAAVPCTTVNKMCGSGMKTMMLGFDMIGAGSAQAVVAGGMESMSNAPYLLPGARTGYRMGHQQLLDHMFYDGLQDPDEKKLMGCYAESCAERFAFSRGQQDAFAIESVTRAKHATESGAFQSEIIPLRVGPAERSEVVMHDEQPARCELEKIPLMKPAFVPETGTVTAANASSISDGAAAVLLMSAERARDLNVRPLARVLAHTTHAQVPAEFTTAPIGAINKLYRKLRWTDADVDLYEINEAFAVVTLAAMRELNLDHRKVNVNGGACALGHPIGASGARIVVTLLHALSRRGQRRGIACLCIGGGEASAIAIEML